MDLKMNRKNILTEEYRDFINGRQLIGYFLDSDTGRLTKAALMLFKAYFEEEEQKGILTSAEEFDMLEQYKIALAERDKREKGKANEKTARTT
jgi:hypothetical protein